MKSKIITTTTTIFFILLAAACGKKAPNCGALPCPTNTGANVVSCMIDGEPFICRGGKPNVNWVCKEGNTIYGSAFGYTNITSRICNNDIQYLQINFDTPLELKTYTIGMNNRFCVSAIINTACSDSIQTGIITITTLTDKVLAGNFSLNAKSATGIRKITNGNFDLAR
jgi:hypothetical protein